MRIGSPPGDTLELSITGYQFPLAADPRQRYSWHLISGRASTAHETWELHSPALTCDESEGLAAWLTAAADALDRAGSGDTQQAGRRQASFTEPNLTFRLLDVVDAADAVLRVGLDLEFRAPSNRRARGAGSPSTLRLTTSSSQLRLAASEWRRDVDRFPDLLNP